MSVLPIIVSHCLNFYFVFIVKSENIWDLLQQNQSDVTKHVMLVNRVVSIRENIRNFSLFFRVREFEFLPFFSGSGNFKFRNVSEMSEFYVVGFLKIFLRKKCWFIKMFKIDVFSLFLFKKSSWGGGGGSIPSDPSSQAMSLRQSPSLLCSYLKTIKWQGKSHWIWLWHLPKNPVK